MGSVVRGLGGKVSLQTIKEGRQTSARCRSLAGRNSNRIPWQAEGTAEAFLRRARPTRVRRRAAEGREGEPEMLRGKDAVCRREEGRPPHTGRTRSSAPPLLHGGWDCEEGARRQGWRGEKGTPSPGGLARGESWEGPERWLLAAVLRPGSRVQVPGP